MGKEITLSDIYRYVALAFHYPQSDWFNDAFLALFFEIAEKAGFSEEVEHARKTLAEPNWLETIQVEYTRLFVTASTGVVAPPYGSVYIDGNGLLYDKFTEKTANYYLEKGFKLQDDQHPPDYLVYQLEFMAMLVQDDHAGLEEFMTEYFRPWFEPFMAVVSSKTMHPYILLVVKLADFFSAPEG